MGRRPGAGGIKPGPDRLAGRFPAGRPAAAYWGVGDGRNGPARPIGTSSRPGDCRSGRSPAARMAHCVKDSGRPNPASSPLRPCPMCWRGGGEGQLRATSLPSRYVPPTGHTVTGGGVDHRQHDGPRCGTTKRTERGARAVVGLHDILAIASGVLVLVVGLEGVVAQLGVEPVPARMDAVAGADVGDERRAESADRPEGKG